MGKDTPFTMYDDAGVDQFLAGIAGEERRGRYVWFSSHVFSLACYNMWGVDQFLAGIEGEERRGRYVWFSYHVFSLACYNMLFIFNTCTGTCYSKTLNLNKNLYKDLVFKCDILFFA